MMWFFIGGQLAACFGWVCFFWYRLKQVQDQIDTLTDQLNQMKSETLIRHQQHALMRAQLKSLTLKNALNELKSENDFKPDSPHTEILPFSNGAPYANSAPDNAAPSDAKEKEVLMQKYQKILRLRHQGASTEMIIQAFDVSRNEIELLDTQINKEPFVRCVEETISGE